MSMQIGFHGGRCCGIKHIHFLQGDPSWGHEPLEKRSPNLDEDIEHPYDPTADGDDFSTEDGGWFCDEAPYETGEKGLERYLKFIAKHSPSCLVEVSLALGYYDQSSWIPVLEKHGFKSVVPEFTNGNSGATIKVFHLIFDKGEVRKEW